MAMAGRKLPSVVTDVVVFTLREEQLKLLLVRRAGRRAPPQWTLPGGFVGVGESLDTAAARHLADETGVSGVYLEQLYTFGRPDRDPRGRIISVAYYALIPSDRLQLRAASKAGGVGWFALDELPELALDHTKIVDTAQERLAAKLEYSTIAFQFMPTEFTLSELQGVYQTILRQPLDKRNFRKRVQALNRLEDTGQLKRNGAHRPAKLYRVKEPNKVEIIK